MLKSKDYPEVLIAEPLAFQGLPLKLRDILFFGISLAGEASAQEVKVGEFFGVNGSCVGIVDFLLSGRVDGAIAGVCIFVDFAMTDTLKSACQV